MCIRDRLPTAWAESGSVQGLLARGGFEVRIDWSDSRPQTALIRSTAGEMCIRDRSSAGAEEISGVYLDNIQMESYDEALAAASQDTDKAHKMCIRDRVYTGKRTVGAGI